MKRTFILALCMLAACEKVSDQPAPPPAVTPPAGDLAAAPESASAQPPGRRATLPTQFDATTVKAGETIGGLQVAKVDVRATPNSETGVAGSVRFSGEAELQGGYRAHFDYPDVKQPCFWVDIESHAKLPRARGDQRLVWFCFENADAAIKQLGALGTQTHATIVVDNYTTHLTQSDAWDTARLVRVVKKEGL